MRSLNTLTGIHQAHGCAQPALSVHIYPIKWGLQRPSIIGLWKEAGMPYLGVINTAHPYEKLRPGSALEKRALGLDMEESV